MINGLWGKKLGMTQVFAQDNKVVPVTVIETGNWVITQIKTQARDGYSALQIGCLKLRYQGKEFDIAWLKKLATYFALVREVPLDNDDHGLEIGHMLALSADLVKGTTVDVFGTTKGCGFAGVIKRHGFAGGGASHGSMMHRRAGSISSYRAQGRVIKGKRMAGHMGAVQRVAKNLQVIEVDATKNVVLVKGSVPGKAGSFLFVRTRG